MKACVIVFPGSNCDRDAAVALEQVTGRAPDMVWHGESSLPTTDFILLPGGFSYGDYLRSGAIANRSAIMPAVIERARAKTPVVGICNGFQVLTEARLLPGALMRNAGLKFVCRTQGVEVCNAGTMFTRRYRGGQILNIPIAHHDGNYFADEETLDRLEGENRIVFRYAGDNPNGSAHAIAGIVNEDGNVLGLMPHPERVCDPQLGGEDGRGLFESIMEAIA